MSNTERGVAFSAEGFLYVYDFSNKFEYFYKTYKVYRPTGIECCSTEFLKSIKIDISLRF